MTNTSQPSKDMNLYKILKEIEALSIVTLDTSDRSKAMSIPVGQFVRFNDVIVILSRHLEEL